MKKLIWLFLGLMALGYITAPSASKPRSSSKPDVPGMGTTRSHEFQDAYEKAVIEYDRNHSGLPPGLVLPNGKTVQEVLESGEVLGGK
jgi:hypothetical protein